MPRGKRKLAAKNIEAAISKKLTEKEAVLAEIETTKNAIAEAKAVLKVKKSELKKIDSALTRLEEQKSAEDTARAEAEKKAKVTEAVQRLIDQGFSMDDILKLLDA